MSSQPKKPGLFGRLFGRGEQPAVEKPAEDSDVVRQEETIPAQEIERAVERAEPAAEDVPQTVADTSMNEPETAALEAAPEPPTEIVEVDEPEPPAPVPPVASGGGWFSRLKAGLTKTSNKLTDGITNVFAKRKLDPETLEELEDLLIQADLGVDTAARISDALAKGRYDKGISPEDVRGVLATEITKVLEPVARPLELDPVNKPHVIMMVGVNGTGKTTTIGKLAANYARSGKKVMMAAGDTFRAAAIDQLKVWGERSGATVMARDVGADSAGLVFDALTEAKRQGCDVLLIDTAGRLQNKQGLMDELSKVLRVLKKVDPDAPHDTLLVLDATTGQNALDQVQVFKDTAGVTGLVMTKLDGTARGGILVAIAAKFELPIHAVGVGEGIDDLQAFDAADFAKAIAVD